MSKNIFENAKTLIDPKIYRFLYVLLKHVILSKNNSQPSMSLVKFVNKINAQIQLRMEKQGLEGEMKINYECDMDNLMNIYKFIKMQNLVFASEIFENVLIMVLSKAFKVDKYEFFGKYIYNNLSFFKFKKRSNIFILQNKEILLEWIIENKLTNLIKKNKIDNIFKADIDINYFKGSNKEKEVLNYTFIHLLLNLFLYTYFDKYNYPDENNQKTYADTNYTDHTSLLTEKESEIMTDNLAKIERNGYLNIIKALFVSVYIYYQNKHSLLINFNKESENLEKLPFIYELSEAGISDINSDIILRPIRIEPNIDNLELNKNWFELRGILGLTKVLLFNKNIKKISIKSCIIKSIYLKNFFRDLNIFENNNIEELDISFNYLKSDADKYLVKIITILKGLKCLNLADNNLKSGLGPFFVKLKDLYKYKKTKLETLYLINCKLDDISFYELGELLKSKYCRLKYLYLNKNNIPSNINFFKSLKKNSSLKELYMYTCGINSEQADDIERIISNTNIEVLYLNDNNIHNFNDYIRIVYRNSLLRTDIEEDNYISYPCLYNLNMNKMDCFNRNESKVKLLYWDIIDKTNLSCLDMSYVLLSKLDKDINNNYINDINKYFFSEYSYEINIEDIKDAQTNYFSFKYHNAIYKEFCEGKLKKKFDEYKKAKKDIEINKNLLEKYNNNIEKNDKNIFIDLDKSINKIINENSKELNYSIFVTKCAKNLLDKNNHIIKKNEKTIENLINYIKFKKVQKEYNNNEDIINEHKLIII